MRLQRVEQMRTTLEQSLILVIMTLVGMIMYLSRIPETSSWIDGLAILCLGSCLFVLFKERELKKLGATLLDELLMKDRAVDHLDRELNAGRFALEEKREKADELEGRLREVTMLYRAIHKVNSEPRNGEVIRTTLRTALELVGGDQGSIMLLDEGKRYLRIEASIGIDMSVAQQIRQKVGEGVAGWVAEFGEPLRLSGEAQDDERFHNLNEYNGRIKSALCVPLKLQNETIGVINLGLAESRAEEFNEYHMSLATIFGEHASLAIMYSRLRHSLFDD